MSPESRMAMAIRPAPAPPPRARPIQDSGREPASNPASSPSSLVYAAENRGSGLRQDAADRQRRRRRREGALITCNTFPVPKASERRRESDNSPDHRDIEESDLAHLAIVPRSMARRRPDCAVAPLARRPVVGRAVNGVPDRLCSLQVATEGLRSGGATWESQDEGGRYRRRGLHRTPPGRRPLVERPRCECHRRLFVPDSIPGWLGSAMQSP